MCHCYVDSALFFTETRGITQVMREGSTMGVTQDTFGPPLGICTGDMAGGGIDVEGPKAEALAASNGYQAGP